MSRSRREFLEWVLSGAAVAAWPFDVVQGKPSLASAQTRHAPLTATPLDDHLHLISGAGGNVLVVASGDGLVLVNGGAAERSTELLKIVAASSGGRRLTTLFNTDWCADHTGSNEAAGAMRAQIIAHEHTKQYLANDQFVEWQKRTYTAKPAGALPTRTFYTKGSMTAGSERLEYGHLGQAHTDGDIYVFLPVSNVLVAGDVLTAGRYPMADYTTGGWLGGLMTATKTLLDLSNANTRVIPGSGPVQTRADLQAQYDMLSTLRDRLAKMMRQGMSAKDMLAAGATKEFDERWGDPTLFLSVTYRGMWLHVRELGGIV
jgi:glyoxylase-like metal-dependent hydrolase (beta-lactamase superfamily II)